MTRRATPENVEFPVVVLGAAILACLRVERMTMLDGDGRFAAGHDRPEALDVLVDARAHEPERDRLSGVFIRFLRKDFSGLSYGLALALADKRARLSAPTGQRLIATGEIVNGGEGRIAAIEGFDAKALQVLDACETSPAPVVFAFAGENWRQAAAPVREALEASAAEGRLTLRPADQLSDLADLWQGEAAPVTVARPQSRKPALAALAIVIAALAGAGAWWSHGRPLRACEAALTAIESAKPGDQAGRIADAVETCAASAKARPRDGRILFLTGQAHALNGGEALADKYWSMSAQAGDPDGLATWGRQRWLSAPGDKATVDDALRYLTLAADRGSPTAMEDMAEIYADGRATGVDLGKAEALLARAKAIREKHKP